MACRCSGLRVDKCTCGFRTSPLVYRVSRPGDAVLPPALPSGRVPLSSFSPPKTNCLAWIVQRIYEKCAGYNLRYCLFRGVSGNDNYWCGTLKDLFILCCFFLANFVVFLTIVTRMGIQVTYIMLDSARWIRRCIKARTNKVPAHTQITTIDTEDCLSLSRDFSDDF